MSGSFIGQSKRDSSEMINSCTDPHGMSSLTTDKTYQGLNWPVGPSAEVYYTGPTCRNEIQKEFMRINHV